MSKARIRTESMVQRLSKKPISEGFELWDRGYLFGAIRLFQFKVENTPPFQVAPCLEALAMLLQQMGEDVDAQEQYTVAIEKYEMIQQPWNARYMKCCMTEIQGGPLAALAEVREVIRAADTHKEPSTWDEKTKAQIAKLYGYRAHLHWLTEDYAAGEADATRACELGWDRVHVGLFTLGCCQYELGNVDQASQTFLKATQKNSRYLAAFEQLIEIYKSQENYEKALEMITIALEIHPKCSLIRDRAYALSELKMNDEALQVLDEGITKPPNDETGDSTSQLHRAKAAVLADMTRYDEALACLDAALDLTPGDDAATRMKADINVLAAKAYLKKHQVPEFLDHLVGHVLRSRPHNPTQSMIDAIESNLV